MPTEIKLGAITRVKKPISATARQVCDQPRFAVRLTYEPETNTDQYWILQDADQLTQLPGGSIYLDARLMDISSLFVSADFRKNSATISKPTIKVLDVKSSFSNLVADKWQDNRAIRYSLVEIFSHCLDEPITTGNLVATFLAETADYHEAVWTIACADIQREAIDSQILEPREFNLVESIRADDSGITEGFGLKQKQLILSGPADDMLFEHSEAYPVHPGETVCYLETETGEVIACSAITDHTTANQYRFIIRERGCFGTDKEPVEVDTSAAIENRSKLIEVPFMREPPSAMLHAFLAHRTPDGRPIPEAWSRGISDWANATFPQVFGERWVDQPSLIKADYLDFPLTLQGPGKSELRKFVQSEILAPLPGLLVPDQYGRLSLKIDEPQYPDQGYTAEFNDDNVDLQSVGILKLVTRGLSNPITLNSGYDWRTDTYRNKPSHYYVDAAELVGPVKPKTFNFKLLGSGVSTNTQRDKLAAIYADNHAYPRLELPFNPLPRAPMVQIGDSVRVNLSHVRHAYNGTVTVKPLDRQFRVVQVRGPDIKGRRSLVVEGGFGRAQKVLDSQLTQHLDDSWYDQLTPITNHIPVVGGELQGTGHQLPPGLYGYTGGNLRIRPEFRATFNQPGRLFMLAVRGELINQSPNPFDGTGMSVHKGGQGGTAGNVATEGDAGYYGTPRPGGGMLVAERYTLTDTDDNEGRVTGTARRQYTLTEPAILSRGQYEGSVPDLPLSNNGGALGGLPADLSGSGGRGADAHQRNHSPDVGNRVDRHQPIPTITEHYLNGYDGGDGGLSVGFVSRGGGHDGLGSMVTDGGDASYYSGSDPIVKGANGAPGAPAVPFWFMDGPFALADMSGVSARFGRSVPDGSTVQNNETRPTGDAVHSAFLPTNGQNVASSIALSQHIPAPAQLDEINPLKDLLKKALEDFKNDVLLQFLNQANNNEGSTGNNLPAPTDVTLTIYDSTSAELFWTKPSNMTNVTGFRIMINGSVAPGGNVGDVSSFFMTGLDPSTFYEIGVAAKNSTTGECSDLVTDSGTTPAGGGGPGPFDFAVTVSASGVISGTAGTGYEGRGGWVSQDGNPTLGFGFDPGNVNGGVWSANNGIPAGMPSGQYKVYIETAGGGNPQTVYFDYVA